MALIDLLLRENIKNLKPYTFSKREDSKKDRVFLDANENSFGSPIDQDFNRYPDPNQWNLKSKIASIKGVPVQNILVGNGNNEIIDLLIKAFCDPGKDNVIILPPTDGRYKFIADVLNVEVRNALLTPDFQPNLNAIGDLVDANSKLLFLCSPNNPTGNSLDFEAMEIILNSFPGIVVLDEAYINFSRQRSLIPELKEYENLVILQTLSKAWGLAGLRIGMAFGGEALIEALNKIKDPYNISTDNSQLAIKALSNIQKVNQNILSLIDERNKLISELPQFPFVKRIFPSDTNFLLVKTEDPDQLYSYLASKGIMVKNCTNEPLCEGCLRITVGNIAENMALLAALKGFQ